MNSIESQPVAAVNYVGAAVLPPLMRVVAAEAADRVVAASAGELCRAAVRCR